MRRQAGFAPLSYHVAPIVVLLRTHLLVLHAPTDSHGTLRIIDDSGGDFLYAAILFEAVEVQEETASRLHQLLAA